MQQIEKDYFNSPNKPTATVKLEDRLFKVFNINIKDYQYSISASHDKILNRIRKDKDKLQSFKTFNPDCMKGICSALNNFVAYYDLLKNQNAYEEVFYSMTSIEKKERKSKISNILQSLRQNLKIFYSDYNSKVGKLKYLSDVEMISSKTKSSIIQYCSEEFILLNKDIFLKSINRVPEGHYINIIFFDNDLDNGHCIIIKKSGNYYSLYDSNFGAIFDIEGDCQIYSFVNRIITQYSSSCYQENKRIIDYIVIEDTTRFLQKVRHHYNNENSISDCRVSKVNTDNKNRSSCCIM